MPRSVFRPRLARLRPSFRLPAALMLALALAIGRPPSAFAGEVTVAGVGAALDLVHELARRFADDHPDIAVTILPDVACNTSIKALQQAKINIAITACPLPAAEWDHPLIAIEWLRTPVVLAVSARSRLDNVSSDELVAIYSGSRRQWSDGNPIRLVLRPPADPDTGSLRSLASDLSTAIESAGRRPGMLIALKDEEVSDLLATVPGAISPTTLGLINARHREIKPLSLNGVAPTLENQERGLYRLMRTVYLVTRAQPTWAAAEFFSFLRSSQHRKLFEASGFVPVTLNLRD